MLSFHVDYFGKDDGKEGQTKPKKNISPPPEAVIDAIFDKHESATGQRRFNAILATASINDAIQYHQRFKELQAQKQAADQDYTPLNIACVFSPPAQAAAKDENGNSKNAADIKQLQEDLPQERADNQKNPEQKKAALTAIITDYNQQYGTNHDINNFDLYYQDVQQRIKDQKYPNADYPHKNKIDITIVVDMLLTGFDSQYLNTLYVDKNLKHHGLIQAFSRTNRVLNDSKPWGNILDFRYQEKDVDAAIELFSGAAKDQAREIWLVDPAPVVVDKYQQAVDQLQSFMKTNGLACEPAQVHNLKGDSARAEFINRFKAVQKLKTQLEQYTDLDDSSKTTIEQTLPGDTLRGFKAIYLDTAQDLKNKQGKSTDPDDPVQQLEFDLVLFASAVIDYDYIIGLIAKSTQGSGKQKMTRAQLIELISTQANLMDERDDIIAYINTLNAGQALNEREIRNGYQTFKAQKAHAALKQIADQHALQPAALQTFVDGILDRMIFDGEQLTDLMAPLQLGWKARRQAELALMEALLPYLQKQAGGREISGLKAYE